MARSHSTFACSDCGAVAAVWAGRCAGCGSWNSMVERVEAAAGIPRPPGHRATPVADVADDGAWPLPTGVAEFDRVLGGGLVPGSVTLLGGEPGIGKSTLLLQVLAGLARVGVPTLYVTAEEAPAQIRVRAERVGACTGGLWLAAETGLDAVVAALDEARPAVCVLDSVQTVHHPDVASAPGSVAQVRACADRLVAEARSRDVAVVLVGHVTKSGTLAGPRVLEHLVDTVLSFEGDRHHALRLLRAVKHRYGSTGELGVFEMTPEGLSGVTDPSALFLGDRRPGTPGSAVAPILDGGRPLLVEVQALLDATTGSAPRRSAQGFDGARLSMLLAVVAQRIGLRFDAHDIWVALVGGVRAAEPAVDLAVVMAVVSAASGRPLASDLVVCGEVGLAGEIRQVARIDRRLAEVARLGFRRVLVPAGAPDPPLGCEAVRVADLGTALEAVGLGLDRV